MRHMSLSELAERAVRNKRMTFADLRRLQRDVLPGGIEARHQAELLIAIDQSLERADRSWKDYLVSSMRDFVMRGLPPADRFDVENAKWLISALSRTSPRTAGAILSEIVRQAPEIDGALTGIYAAQPAGWPKSRIGNAADFSDKGQHRTALEKQECAL